MPFPTPIYVATQCAVPIWRMVLCYVRSPSGLCCYAMSGTELSHVATQCPVLSWRMVRPQAAMIGLFAVLNLSAFVRLRKEHHGTQELRQTTYWNRRIEMYDALCMMVQYRSGDLCYAMSGAGLGL
eukprot:2217743-Rhodomonas_salina.6